MKNLKRLTLVTTAVMAFTALVASTPASATTLEVGGAAQSKTAPPTKHAPVRRSPALPKAHLPARVLAGRSRNGPSVVAVIRSKP
jgi:hypothetical protein